MASSRRSFLLSAAGVLAAGAAAPALAANQKAKPATMHADAALKNLMDGNARFVAGQGKCYPMQSRVLEVAEGQEPFATVLGCSDSRVPVEIVFDRRPGDIFTVRVAGNFVTTEGLGSIEYGSAVLKSPLIMVLGHTSCGAVGATVKFIKDNKPLPGQVQSLVDAILPAAKASQHQHGDWVYNAIVENVNMNVHKLRTVDPIMSALVQSGKIRVVGAVYDLHTGKVTLTAE